MKKNKYDGGSFHEWYINDLAENPEMIYYTLKEALIHYKKGGPNINYLVKVCYDIVEADGIRQIDGRIVSLLDTQLKFFLEDSEDTNEGTFEFFMNDLLERKKCYEDLMEVKGSFIDVEVL